MYKQRKSIDEKVYSLPVDVYLKWMDNFIPPLTEEENQELNNLTNEQLLDKLFEGIDNETA